MVLHHSAKSSFIPSQSLQVLPLNQSSRHGPPAIPVTAINLNRAMKNAPQSSFELLLESCSPTELLVGKFCGVTPEPEPEPELADISILRPAAMIEFEGLAVLA